VPGRIVALNDMHDSSLYIRGNTCQVNLAMITSLKNSTQISETNRQSDNVTELSKTTEAAAFDEELPSHDVEPLWRRLGTLLPAEPKSPAVPYVWRYADLRPLLMRAGEVVTAEEAERRVLMLMNPGLQPTAAAAVNLYAGLQL